METRALDLSHHWASGAARVYILAWLKNAVVVGSGACSPWKILKSTCTCSEITSGGFWDFLYHSRHGAEALSVFRAHKMHHVVRQTDSNIRASYRLMWKLLHHTQLAPPTFALVEPKVSRHLYVLSNPLAMLLQVLKINFSIGTARTKRGSCLKSSDHIVKLHGQWFLLPVATCTCSEITSGGFWDFLYQFKTKGYATVRLFLCL